MDGRCFDSVTRILATASSRRQATLAVGGGLLAGLLGVRGAGAACGKLNDDCDRDRDCCRRYTCDNRKCKRRACGRLDARCKRDSDCCRRYVCSNRKCQRP